MKNKHFAILYFITLITGLMNAYFAYKNNNIDAVIAWTVAAGFSGAASGAYMKLHDLEKDNEND